MNELTYIFTPNQNIQKDLINKINNNYILKKIKITLNNEVSNDDMNYLNMSFDLGQINDTINYYNNIIEFLCDPFIRYMSVNNEFNFFNNDINIKEIEVNIIYLEEKYNTIRISNNENIFILKSNCFDTLSELQNEFIKLTETNENIFNKWLELDYACTFYINKINSNDTERILLEKDV